MTRSSWGQTHRWEALGGTHTSLTAGPGPKLGVSPLRATVPFCPGVYREPSLSAQPGSLVQSGDSLTLLCRSETGFDRFALTKDEELRAPQRLDGQPSPNFTLGPVSPSHGGQYSCYYGHKLSSTWSAPSAPLDVLITGEEPPAPRPDSGPGNTVAPG